MIKKIAIGFLALALVVIPMSASKQRIYNLLAAAVDVDASATAVNGVDFVSAGVPAAAMKNYSQCAIIVIFGRAAGSASTVDIELSVSNDGGLTWSLLREATSLDEVLIQVPINTTAIEGNTVRVSFMLNIIGFDRLRVESIENTDGANNITDCQVQISM